MSFDANIGRATPIIKAASNMNNDGGSGGNTGYMTRGRKKKDDNRGSLFSNDNSLDTFEFGSKLKDIEPPTQQNSWVESLIKKITK